MEIHWNGANQKYVHFLQKICFGKYTNKLQKDRKKFKYCVAFNTSLLMQYLLMTVFVILETKVHYRISVMTITTYVLASFPLFGLSTSRVIPNVGILVVMYCFQLLRGQGSPRFFLWKNKGHSSLSYKILLCGTCKRVHWYCSYCSSFWWL